MLRLLPTAHPAVHLCLPVALAAVGALLLQLPAAFAGDGEVLLRVQGTNTLIQVNGEAEDDWQIQVSDDLVNWRDLSWMGTLLSGGDDAPAKSLPTASDSLRFYRARRTEGLYDPTVFRTISLTFTQANWATLLTRGRTTGSNTLGDLVLDNGAAVPGIGARYKGNTSFDMGGAKKSVNIEMDFATNGAALMGYSTINLNNAAGDETIMREPLYFTVMQRYAVCPKGALAKLYINGAYWGVYSLAQNGDGDLVKEWFPSNNGDRWRAPNMAGAPGAGPVPGGQVPVTTQLPDTAQLPGTARLPPGGGGGGMGSAVSALSYQGTNVATYKRYYELKKQNTSNAWENLVHTVDVLNNTPQAELRDKVEDVLAVDRWLWFLVLENLFADDDSYWNKGADYAFYYEPESGRIHPLEHDGNESFVAGDVQLSPVQGAASTGRPVLYRLLSVPELRQRYLAHMRTVLEETYNPPAMTELIDRFHALSIDAIIADPKKNFTMSAYTNDLRALKNFVTNRYRFLTNHAELKPVPPTVLAVSVPPSPAAGSPALITAEVQPYASEGIDSVWLYFRDGVTGKFSRRQMFDDGAHEDGAAGDGLYTARTDGFLAGAKVRYYVEARSGNAAKAASFAPPQAEEGTYSYRVTTAERTDSPLVINELMADNSRTLADPQGEFDDWIELHNRSAQTVDLSGSYLSDNPDNPRKWQFPQGTSIPAGGFLLVWADEDGQDTPGLHASFRLSKEGETILLVDTDTNLNALLDSVTFGPLGKDRSYGRSRAAPQLWREMSPTPDTENE